MAATPEGFWALLIVIAGGMLAISLTYILRMRKK